MRDVDMDSFYSSGGRRTQPSIMTAADRERDDCKQLLLAPYSVPWSQAHGVPCTQIANPIK
jgi:hypothetical protein